MNWAERERTLCFPLRDQQVLLGLKKRGFGKGFVTGFGGKLETGETIVQAAARELWEECALRAQPQDLLPAGCLLFEFPTRPDWSQRVWVYLLRDWQGAATESDEMLPTWHALSALPYPTMFIDAPYWLPLMLVGLRLRMHFTFSPDADHIDALRWVVLS